MRDHALSGCDEYLIIEVASSSRYCFSFSKFTGTNPNYTNMLSDLFEYHLVRSEDTLESINFFLKNVLVSTLGRENCDFLDDEDQDVGEDEASYPSLSKSNFQIFYKSKVSAVQLMCIIKR